MRALVVSLLLGGCLAGQLDSNARPSAMPMLSELPTDPEKRNAILDQSGHTPGPEQRKGMTKRQKKAETMAAVAAAILGQAFSKTQNATLGTATTVDENRLFDKPRQRRAPGAASDGASDSNDDGDGDGDGDADGQPTDTQPIDDPAASDLVPWIDLQKSKPADIDSVR